MEMGILRQIAGMAVHHECTKCQSTSHSNSLESKPNDQWVCLVLFVLLCLAAMYFICIEPLQAGAVLQVFNDSA